MRYSLLSVAYPLLDNPYRYKVDTGGQRLDEAMISKRADIWP